MKALLSHGVPIDITDRSGKTGLHAAAVQGQIKILEYLISKGANINAIDRYGDSPLEIAITEKHDEAAKFLSERGAQRMRGDAATRDKASKDIVREDIDAMLWIRRNEIYRHELQCSLTCRSSRQRRLNSSLGGE